MLVAALAGLSLYALGFGIFVVTLPAAGSGTAATADAIVALTGEGDRLAPAVALLERAKGKRLLITGVNPRISRDYLKKLLHAGETFDCCADLGFAAFDTRGNAQEAAEWARAYRYTSLIVVTADYHMPRTLVEFSAALPGLRLLPYPVADPPETLSWQSAKRLNGEFAKYLASVFHSWLVRYLQAA